MNLQLSLKTKWFEMTKVGIKTEDYREINDYWIKRLCHEFGSGFDSEKRETIYMANFKDFSTNIMTLGYPKANSTGRILRIEHKGIEIRTGNPEWGAELNKMYFVIKHGNINYDK